MYYLFLKSLHVLSVVLFIGNIVTGVFWKVHADIAGDLRSRAQALAGIIASDRVFTMPGVLLIIAGTWNQSEYEHLSRRWQIWGLVATLTPVVALFLMVMKPA